MTVTEFLSNFGSNPIPLSEMQSLRLTKIYPKTHPHIHIHYLPFSQQQAKTRVCQLFTLVKILLYSELNVK